jgi:hypothetical protein
LVSLRANGSNAGLPIHKGDSIQKIRVHVMHM